MLLKGLPRAQLFSPVWTARKRAILQQRASKSTDREPNGQSQSTEGPTLSLFEELFPEENKKSHGVKFSPKIIGGSQGPIRRVSSGSRSNQPDFQPTFKLNKYVALKDKTSAFPENNEIRSDGIAGSDQQESLLYRDAHVLVLNNASKSLSLSDFLRLSPKGEHIDGWASGIIKVIPGRDPNTLELQGHYFILFSTAAAARAYMDKAIRLHSVSKTHTPTSILSPLPPPPGYLKDGEDLHALMQIFTLIPSSQERMSIRMLKKPFHPSTQRMIAAGGHPALTSRKAISEDLVLLSLDRGDVSIYDLRAAIGRDGKERNLQWNLLPRKDAVVKLDGGKVETEKVDMGSKLEALHEGEDRKRKRKQLPRFILSFKDNHEARRFVRAWHRRPLPSRTVSLNEGDEGPPIVNAELLW